MATPTHDFYIDWGRDGTYGHASANVTAIVEAFDCAGGMTTYNQEMGQAAMAAITLRNDAGQWLMDNVGAAYYSLLKRGVLIRWRLTYGGTTQQMWAGRIAGASVPNLSAFAANKQVMLQASDWTDDMVAGTYAPKLTEDVRVDTELATVMESGAVPMPYASSGWVLGYSTLEVNTTLIDMSGYYEFDTAQETLEYVGDESGTEQGTSAFGYIQDLVMAEMGGRFLYDPRATKYRFRDRQRDLRTSTVTATLTAALLAQTSTSGVQMPPLVWGDTMVSSVALSYELRTAGAAGSVIWTAENLPRLLRAGKDTRYSVRFRDPDALSPCGATDVLYPVAGTDYTANAASDGTGADMLTYLRVLTEINARGASIRVFNTHATTDLYVRLMQIRGTPLVISDRRTVEKKDAANIGAHGLRHVPADVPYASDERTVESYAKILLAGGNPISRFSQATFDAWTHDTLMQYARDVDIGERVKINLSGDSWTEHSRDYIVVGYRYTIHSGKPSLGITWILKPVVAARGWILEDAVCGVLETTTYVVF